MGVNRTTYLGVYVDIIELEIEVYDDKYERYTCGFPDERFSIIYDGMGGEYAYFGITMESVEDDADVDLVVFEEVDIKGMVADIYLKYESLFGAPLNDRPKLMMFNHFS